MAKGRTAGRTIVTNTIVAIDGPAAAGKTTVAQLLAQQLDALLFDTGTLYRAVTLLALRTGSPVDDGNALAVLAANSEIEIKPPSVADGRLYDVRLDGEDVTWAIRDRAVDAAAAPVSAHPQVRDALLAVQRRIARQGRVVIVGRDIGTVIVPDASVKIFLDASPAERARRRHQELIRRNRDTPYEDVLADIAQRDRIDANRDTAPLRPAADATVIVTDGLTIPQVVAKIKEIVDATWRPLATA
jgi:cytidylate kinase